MRDTRVEIRHDLPMSPRSREYYKARIMSRKIINYHVRRTRAAEILSASVITTTDGPRRGALFSGLIFVRPLISTNC